MGSLPVAYRLRVCRPVPVWTPRVVVGTDAHVWGRDRSDGDPHRSRRHHHLRPRGSTLLGPRYRPADSLLCNAAD